MNKNFINYNNNLFRRKIRKITRKLKYQKRTACPDAEEIRVAQEAILFN
jgi:hypothetical protein